MLMERGKWGSESLLCLMKAFVSDFVVFIIVMYLSVRIAGLRRGKWRDL